MLSQALTVLFLATSVTSIAVRHRQRFPGPYCQTRRPLQCCPGRDDSCTVPIRDTVCYCDEFCGIHNAEDCCPDYENVCLAQWATTSKSPPTNECFHEGRLYGVGQTIQKDCNTCKCVTSWSNLDLQTWECENLACINEPALVEGVNRGRYGWTARVYNKFDGVSVIDGLRYYLGTIPPKSQVKELFPVKANIEGLPIEFDSREQWPTYIHPAMDQGRCAASWAFSTAGVTADRWSIQSGGEVLDDLSVQRMISCGNVEGCDNGGRVEDAWSYLQKEGTVSEYCHPYTSGVSRQSQRCTYIEESACRDNLVYKTTPPYRIARDERRIMKEIMRNGPVQAIITVHPDFYLYESGIYSHTREEFLLLERNHTISGTHSVKIIGYGEENGVKFWRCVNSWGQSWGERGMFRIKRGTDEVGIEDFVVAVWPSHGPGLN
ncbi:tubulointerstitial nephritis antigen-like [Watersipora subatra]|uniref:tubulointerstitial nephritis antigen-like n=1 Tax=Watersipora subatra TaxID=2589382 RepID=UPI00355C33A6